MNPLNSGIGQAVKAVGDFVDDLYTTDEEELQQRLEKIEQAKDDIIESIDAGSGITRYEVAGVSIERQAPAQLLKALTSLKNSSSMNSKPNTMQA